MVHEPMRQIARSRNTGASIAKGQWLVFIDADSIPSEALLLDLKQTLKADREVGGGAPLCVDRELPVPIYRPGQKLLSFWVWLVVRSRDRATPPTM